MLHNQADLSMGRQIKYMMSRLHTQVQSKLVTELVTLTGADRTRYCYEYVAITIGSSATLVWAEIECTVHIVIPKQPIN